MTPAELFVSDEIFRTGSTQIKENFTSASPVEELVLTGAAESRLCDRDVGWPEANDRTGTDVVAARNTDHRGVRFHRLRHQALGGNIRAKRNSNGRLRRIDEAITHATASKESAIALSRWALPPCR